MTKPPTTADSDADSNGTASTTPRTPILATVPGGEAAVIVAVLLVLLLVVGFGELTGVLIYILYALILLALIRLLMVIA